MTPLPVMLPTRGRSPRWFSGQLSRESRLFHTTRTSRWLGHTHRVASGSWPVGAETVPAIRGGSRAMPDLGRSLQGVGFLGMVICMILVVVKMFQHGHTGLGILTIVLACVCGIGFLFSFIYGWMKANQWGIRNVMLAYTVCFVLSIVGGCIAPPPVNVPGYQ